MLLRAWLLLSCLSLVQLQQRLTLPKLPRDAECQSSDLHLIKAYFEETTILREGTTVPQNCINQNPHGSINPRIDLDQVINFYRSLDFVHSFSYVNTTGPVKQTGVLSVNDHQELPLYHIADIRKCHLPYPNSYPEFGEDVNEQMDLMGQRRTDDTAYLLAHSLGGSSRAINMIPMARNVNRHLPLVPEDAGLGIPRSYWRSNEKWIRKFLLNAYPNGRVVWKIAVQYEEKVLIDPAQGDSYRPLSFSLQYTAFTNEHDDNSVYYISPPTTFLNENNVYCKDDETTQRNRQNISVPIECEVHTLNKHGTIGKTTSEGNSYTRREVSFPFTTEGKTYFYGQSVRGDDQQFRWFIQELLPNGQMGEEKDAGYWNVTYSVTFPFFMNGTQYIYGHSVEDKTWFIRELLANGKMGQVRSSGTWLVDHPVSFPFTINGKHYFYGERFEDNYRWFIQELLPNGLMGDEMDTGTLSGSYPVVFSYSINGRHMFYAHNPESNHWFVRELLPDGKMGEQLDEATWKGPYQVSFPYIIKGKHYFYGLRSVSSYRWFIQELLPNGKMSSEISSGWLSEGYEVAFPFVIDGRQFMYSHSTETMNWMIQELL